ncbi:MAG: RNA polymerase sigma factor [Pirellulaceae bacterium]
MTVDDEEKLDASLVAALYGKHAAELHRFLMGVLRDSQLASDVLQTTFTRLVEQGHRTREESRKSWLFRVAYHEALAVRRSQARGERHLQRVAWSYHRASPAADERTLRAEQVESVREALNELPPLQQQVVRMRIYEEKTFAVIAEELGIPLGTALGRMRSALIKLQHRFEAAEPPAQSGDR